MWIRDAIDYVLGGGRRGLHAVEGGGRGSRIGNDCPDAGVVVGAAGREVADVGGEEHASDVGGVGGKGADGDERSDVSILDQFPDVNVALERSGLHQLCP